MELGGVGAVHAAFLNGRQHTRPCPVLRGRKSRSPGFPVELGGVGAVHAAFLNEGSTRGHVQCCVAGNPGRVGMTGKGNGSIESGCRTEVFSLPWVGRRPLTPLSKHSRVARRVSRHPTSREKRARYGATHPSCFLGFSGSYTVGCMMVPSRSMVKKNIGVSISFFFVRRSSRSRNSLRRRQRLCDS